MIGKEGPFVTIKGRYSTKQLEVNPGPGEYNVKHSNSSPWFSLGKDQKSIFKKK